MTLIHRMISQSRITPAILGLSTVAGLSALTLFLFDPAHYTFYPVCYFHLVTGLYCPGCGALRAIHQLIHGHFVEAVRLNLLVVLSLPAALTWQVRRIRPFVVWWLIAFCAVFTVARNVPAGKWLTP